jgi:chemotaxis protein histidine kinase CheA
MANRNRGENGLYAKGESKFESLFKFESMEVFKDEKSSALYQLNSFFEVVKVDPDSFLKLPEESKRAKIALACRSKESSSSAQVMFYMVQKFLELNGKALSFTRTQKRSMFKRAPYKNGKQHIPKTEEVYRMVDSFPKRNLLQQLRGKALILCQWQSGVRSTCLSDWRYGMFRDRLNVDAAPLEIKVVSKREKKDWTVALDTKLSAYGLGFYYTFIGKEAVQALHDYLEARKSAGWQPQDEDHVFVTEGTIERAKGNPILARHVLNNVKTAAHQIGLNPQTVWAHLLRKSFRNVLRRAGLEDDVCEALMGHTLPNSQGSYFDSNDLEQARREYRQAERYFSRIDVVTVEQLQEGASEIVNLKSRLEELAAENTQLKEKAKAKDADLEGRLAKMEKLLSELKKETA